MLTKHAQTRLQQRAIPPIVVELLERFGAAVRSDGAETLFFDKSAQKELRRYLGGDRGFRLIEEWLEAYVVVSDAGPVVTAGHRVRHLQRDRSQIRGRCRRSPSGK